MAPVQGRYRHCARRLHRQRRSFRSAVRTQPGLATPLRGVGGLAWASYSRRSRAFVFFEMVGEEPLHGATEVCAKVRPSRHLYASKKR
ncbi:hypothetical protein VNO80_10442 [Phaseolus coccineus]|uniref:Uncharacterized protein n=1 Tax=Phaseolus coccineus TaxID=3886 RepID=A0AAN9RDU7_PHACN